ncbi:MAG: alpha/beta hydrolase family protein [Capnocytophaga sp.]|nr:alpha/beta hydrolase family protein [Capnocytophaga sp.]
MKTSITLLLFLYSIIVHAATIDTIRVASPSMNKFINVVVIIPDGHPSLEKYPVIYLLHGHNGNVFTWLNIKPELPAIADEKKLIFVCPDGENSWYWNSPIDTSFCYETFISKELTAYIDAHYPTQNNRNGRAISGLSMGGHGALWNAFQNPDTFGACGSMSGGVDIRPFPEKWNIADRLGSIDLYPYHWDRYTVINLVEKISENQAIIIDCGKDDFFLSVNNDLHNKLSAHTIPHDYIIRPGSHDATYWNNAVDYQILYFEKFFKNKKY